MSLTYLLLLSVLEIYLMIRKDSRIYLTTMFLFYGYVYFLCIFFYKVAEIQISKIEVNEITCYEKAWQ